MTCVEKLKNKKIARSSSNRNSAKASTAKPLVKPPPGNKYIVLEPAIRVYEIYDSDNTKKVKYAEILGIQDKRLVTTKQNLTKRKFPYINTFNHKVPAVACVMRNLTIGVFEHLEIAPPLFVDEKVNYMQRLLRGLALKKYKKILVECK